MSMSKGSGFNELANSTEVHGQAHDASWAQNSGPPNLPVDPIKDLINDPDDDPVRQVSLNERQRWIVEELAKRGSMKSRAIVRRWEISEKTAKRDISVLKGLRLVEFSGSRKTGSYRLIRH